MRLTPDIIRAAIVRHETGWFDMYLNPIVPQVGQRFSEVEIGEADEGNATVYEEGLVEYVGVQRRTTYNASLGDWITETVEVVWDDSQTRTPRGEILILQH